MTEEEMEATKQLEEDFFDNDEFQIRRVRARVKVLPVARPLVRKTVCEIEVC